MRHEEEKTPIGHHLLTIIGIVMCVVLIPILTINCILLIKGYTNRDEVPMINGVCPMIVLTNSMEGTFDGGDLIFIKTTEPEEVQNGDVIAFFDPLGNGLSVVSHRVLEVITEEDGISFRTKGDANDSEDLVAVPGEKLIGTYTGFHIPGAGRVAMFMQTTTGLIVCVLIPVLLLVGYDILRRRAYEKKHDQDKDELLAELEELRKLKAQQSEGNQAAR